MAGMDYSRAQTAIAMAKGEVWELKAYLVERARLLRREADQIEAMLETVGSQTDSWYETIKREWAEDR